MPQVAVLLRFSNSIWPQYQTHSNV